MDFVAFIIGVVVGAFLGWRINERIHQAILPDMFKRLGVTPEKLENVMGELQKEMHELNGTKPNDSEDFPQVEIRIEQHGEQLYAFRKDNEEFLGQGASKEALIERMGEKLSNVRLVVGKEDGAELIGHESFNYDTAKKELSKSSS